MIKRKLPLCECGCDQKVTSPGNRYIVEHNGRGKRKSIRVHRISERRQ